MRKTTLIAAAAAIAAIAGAAVAQSAAEAAVKARKSHMQLYAFNVGTLAAMAKGDVPYDAAAATAAAANLLALSSLDQSAYWVEGSAQGEVEGSRALPAIWADGAAVMEKVGAFNSAVQGLAAAAGTDQAALQAAIGPVGAACGACHESFRATE
jgi:cytochrome c556